MKKILPIKKVKAQVKKLACLLGLILTLSFNLDGQEITLGKTVTPTNICNRFDVELTITGQPVQRPIEAVLVIDHSGSMNDTNPWPITEAQKAAKEFAKKILVDEYISGNKVSIVSYSDYATIDIGLTSNYNDVKNAIDDLNAYGFTNIAHGFDKAKYVLENQGTFDCQTIRTIILLTDGVANRAPYYYNCSWSCDDDDDDGDKCCWTSPTSPTCCTKAAISSGQATHTINNYETKVYSIGLFGAISGAVQNVASTTMNQAQNSGFWSTESAADLTGIYNQISDQLVWAAKDATITETVDPGFSIVSSSISESKGTATQTGQVITWNIDYIYDETDTLAYIVEANNGTCGTETPSTSTITYENSQCTQTNANFTNPTVCVPCAEITGMTLTQQSSCSCGINYSATINETEGCSSAQESFEWRFYLDNNYVGTSSQQSGTFTIPGGNCAGNSGKIVKGVVTRTYTGTSGCQLSISDSTEFTIPECCDITVTASSNSPVCEGTTLELSETGGSATSSWAWTGPGGFASLLQNPTINNVTSANAGTYKVVVEDDNGCTDSATVDVTVIPTPDVFNIPDTIVCESFVLPTIQGNNLTARAGYFTGPNGTGSKYIAGTTISNTVTLYIYDETASTPNCWDQEEFKITVTSPDITLDKTDVLCNGGNTGKAWVTATQGIAPYTYLWNDPATSATDTASNLTAGWYTVAVTDANGCSATDSIEVEEPTNALSISFDPVRLVCYGADNGTATANANGGTSPYTYLWSNGSTTNTASNLPVGNHRVEVWDTNDCYAIDSITISQYDSLYTEIKSQKDISCNGLSDGKVTVQAFGGAGAYSIYIDGNSQGSPHQNPKTFTNLSQGWHVIEVFNYNPSPLAPSPSCSSVIDSIYISEPDLLEVELVLVDSILCHGDSSASLTFNVTGGVELDTFYWYRYPGAAAPVAMNYPNDTLTGLPAWNWEYMVKVVDINGCTADDNISITQPEDLTVTITDEDDIDCFGGTTGSATAEANGGVAPYTYVWNTTPQQTGATATGLASGTYQVVVTDANGCQDSTTVTIEESSNELEVDITKTDVQCPGDKNGTATAIVTGGQTPYSYSWNTNPVQETQTATGLGIGSYTVTVTDANKCVGTENITINQLDTIPPEAICKNFIAKLDTNGQVTILAADVDGGSSDNCNDWDIAKHVYPSEFDCEDVGDQLVWLVVTDAAGNKDSCQATVTVVDEIDPTAICKDTTVYLDENGQFFLNAKNLDNGSFDNCTDVTLEIVPNIMTCDFVNEAQVPENVALFVYDEYGNFDVCIADVTVLDTIVPGIICPDDFNIYRDASCEFVIKDYTNMVIATDNCTIDTIMQSPVSGTIIETETTITFTAYDKSGNSSSCEITVTPIDEDKPTIICPANQFVSLDSTCSFTLPDYKVMADIFEGCESIGGLDTLQVPAPGTIIYDSTEVTLYVSDLSGNGDSCSFWVYPADNTPPEVVCPGPITVQCIDEIPEADSTLVVATDNCDDDILVEFMKDEWDGNTCPETLTRTYLATDDAGNTNTCTQTITVMDTTNPTFTVPEDIAIYKDDTCGFVATVDITGDVTDEADNCDTNLDATFKDTEVPNQECIGTTIIIRTWTLVDACGNDTAQEQTITVMDTISPTFTVPADVTVYKDENCEYDASVQATGDVEDEADNCSTGLEATFEDQQLDGSCEEDIIIKRTWTLVDDCENTITKVQLITVKDTLAPAISCNARGDTILYLNENCEVALPSFTGVATVSDNCTDNEGIILTQVPEAGTMVSGAESPVEVWIYAEDACSNVDSCNITITLVDTIPPMVECPANDSIPLNEDCEAIIPDYTFTLLSDNCTDSTSIVVTQDPIAGTAITDVTTVILTAEDLAGNSSSCSFDVIPYAMEFDSIACPVDTTIFVDENCEATIPELSPEILFASCSEFQQSYNWEQLPEAGSTVGVGTYNVVLNVYLVEELVKTCEVTITVEDTIPPVLDCPEGQLVAVDENCDFVIPDYTSGLDITDNCTEVDSITITQSPEAGTVLEGHGTEQVVWVYAEDGYQNIDSCSFMITLQDTLPPVVNCPEDQEIPLNEICEVVVPEYTFSSLSDNCTDSVNIVVSQAPIAGTVITDTTEVTLTATDEAGNSNSCSFNIFPTISDSTIIVCPEDETIFVDENCEATVPELNPQITPISCTDLDNFNIVQTPAAGTVVGLGITSVTIQVFEGDELVETCDVTVTVEDNTIDVVCPTDITLEADAECEAVIPDFTPDIEIIENCTDIDDVIITQSPAAGTTVSTGTTVVTITVTDESGNTSTCTVDVTVEDNTNPTITCPEDVTIEAQPSDCEAEVSVGQPVVDDNCEVESVVNDFNNTANASGFYPVGETIVTWTVTDESGNTAECTMTVTVVPVPLAVDDQVKTPENTPVDINILVNDLDCDDLDNTTIVIVEDPENGTVTIIPGTDTVTYSPDNGFDGTDEFIYRVCNTSGMCDTAVVTIVIDNTNNPPVAENDINITDINTPVSGNVLTNDHDPDGDPLSTTKLTDPANGTVTLDGNGGYTYTPSNGFVGTDEFDYVACDNGGLCDTATVTIEITVITPNTVVAVNDNTSGKVNTPVTGNVLVNDFDPENDNITLNTTPIVQPQNGSVTINADGTFTYTPDQGFVGVDQFTYEICDDGTPQACDQAVVTIDIRDIPDDKNTTVAVDDVYNATEGDAITGNVSDNDYDPEGDSQITFTVLNGPSNGNLQAFNTATGEFTYVPAEGFTGTDSYTYQVCDDNADQACDIATVYIHYFEDPNLPPVAENDINSTTVDTPVSGNVLTNDSDPDGDELTVNTILLTPPSNGSVTISSNGTYTYTPENGFVGEDTFVYEVCDAGGLCDTATVFIAVVRDPEINENRPPEAIDDNTRGKINTPVTGDLIANDFDPDGDEITITTTPVTPPQSGTLTINSDGTFNFVPETGFTGVITFEYEICDNGDPVLCDIALVTIEIEHEENTNTTFAVDDMYQMFNLGESIQGNVADNDYDPEGHTQQFSLISGPSNGELVLNDDGTFTYTPDGEFYGTDSYIYEVCDDGTPQACDQATVYILVEEPREALPPITPEDDFFTATCETIFKDVLENDDVLLSGITMPVVEMDVQNGTLSFNANGTFEYTPNEGFIGLDSFTYQICWADEPENCGTATVYIDVVYDEACFPCPELFVPDAFSPNGDGNHDYFVVECIEELYPTAKLIIFNRWGNLIYEKQNYGNTSVWDETEAFWDGTSQHDWTVGNEKVPVGTYMFVLILNEEKVVKGTVYINY